jgi:hypothetical protein
MPEMQDLMIGAAGGLTTYVAIKGMDQLTAPVKQATRSLFGMKETVMQMGLMIGTSSTFIVNNLLRVGAQSLQVKKAYEIMAADMGASSAQLLKDLTRLAGGAVDQTTLMLEANKAMIAKIPIDAIKKLMEIARAAATATGQSITEVYQRLVGGVSRMETELLKGVGIIIRQDELFKEYAKTLGKTQAELTSTERFQAFLNKTMSEGAEIIRKVGDAGSQVTEMEVFQQMTSAIMDMKSAVGEALVPALLPFIELITKAAKWLGEHPALIAAVIKALTGLGVTITTLIGIMKIWNLVSSLSLPGLVAMAGGAVFSMIIMDKLAAKMSEVTDESTALRQEFYDLATSINTMSEDELIAAQARLVELAAKIKDLGVSMDQPLSIAIEKITKKLETMNTTAAGSTEEVSLLQRALDNLMGSITKAAEEENVLEKRATDTLDALLNQQKVEKEKWQTTEEFGQSLRDLGLAEQFVQQAMKDGSIQIEGQDNLLEALGDTYLSWMNTLRTSQGLVNLTAEQIALLSEAIKNLMEDTSQAAEQPWTIVTPEIQKNGLNNIESPSGISNIVITTNQQYNDLLKERIDLLKEESQEMRRQTNVRSAVVFNLDLERQARS